VFSVPQNGDIGLAAGDLALFGLAGQESVELVVKSIEPQNDLNAKLTCVDAAPAIHGADSGAIPAFSSQITVPQELQRPPAPVVSHIQSGAEALIRHADGSVTTRVMITLKPPSFPARLQVQAQIRAKDESAFRAAEIFAQSPTHVSLTDVAEGEIYDIRLRYFTDTGIFSPPATIAGHS